jgi:hypothetical protein
MAKGLRVTLSMEWQCEQLACANALPARTLGSALHEAAAANVLKAITTGDRILGRRERRGQFLTNSNSG